MSKFLSFGTAVFDIIVFYRLNSLYNQTKIYNPPKGIPSIFLDLFFITIVSWIPYFYISYTKNNRKKSSQDKKTDKNDIVVYTVEENFIGKKLD